MLTIQTKGITHYSYKVEMEAKQQQNVIFRDGESYATRRLKNIVNKKVQIYIIGANKLLTRTTYPPSLVYIVIECPQFNLDVEALVLS